MSDQRPEWMPSIWSVERLCGGISELEPFVSVEMRRTGLRAQIAVLEGEDAHMVLFHGGYYNDENREHRNFMLAKLRKEIGE